MSSYQRFGMRIGGISAYAPRHRISNDRIAARLRKERMSIAAEQRRNGHEVLDRKQKKQFETSDRWIRRFIGFSERRFAADAEGTIDLAARAALALLAETGLRPAEIDGIVFGTVTPSYLNSPPDAAILQDRLGIPTHIGESPREFHCIDCSLACSTWVTSLHHAYMLISSGMAKNVLVIGADKMSTTINWRDRAFACVLGDAGTATWCIAVPPEEDWFSPKQFWSWASGKDGDVIITPAGGSSRPIQTEREIREYQNRLTMDGAMVRELMVPLIGGPGIQAALKKAGWTLGDIDLATLHEANLTLNQEIITQWKRNGFQGTVLDAGGQFGNTTSASIPLAVALNAAALSMGKRFVWFAFGGGLSASAVLGQVKHPLTAVISV
ncbi:MAG: 3-oxoacyl-[acyl-carrier-protein] synthase III C-terminal domain-containing protein [Candidatus Zixiibacteriota bacterium]